MNLESHARRLQSDHNYHKARAYPEAHIAKVWQLLTQAGDQRRDLTLLELRLIGKELDRIETLFGDQVTRLLNLTEYVIEFAEAVNDAIADAEQHVQPTIETGTSVIDDAMVDRMAAFYTPHGHDIR